MNLRSPAARRRLDSLVKTTTTHRGHCGKKRLKEYEIIKINTDVRRHKWRAERIDLRARRPRAASASSRRSDVGTTERFGSCRSAAMSLPTNSTDAMDGLSNRCTRLMSEKLLDNGRKWTREEVWTNQPRKMAGLPFNPTMRNFSAVILGLKEYWENRNERMKRKRVGYQRQRTIRHCGSRTESNEDESLLELKRQL
jgi:hypothetical protein